MPRQKLGLPGEPKGFGQNEGMKMKKSVHPASRKPETHHFLFLSLQVEFYRDIQAISKQAKHWERSREHQASSKEPQASLKVVALPYSSLTETGISQTSISLFRNI